MPFTFSHPALVLPVNYFLKKRTSVTALIAGSIVPDFEYFIRDFHRSHYSHTWAGLFYIDLPAGLFLCFLYHNLVRTPLYLHAPLFLKRRMVPFQSFHWNRWFRAEWPAVLACILIGAFSHLVWDKFTHRSVPLVQAASGFKNFVSGTDRHMTYFLFWDISSFLGGFFVLYALWLLPPAEVPANRNSRRYWLCLLGSMLLLFGLQLPFAHLRALDDMVIRCIDALLLGLVLTSLCFAGFFPRSAAATA